MTPVFEVMEVENKLPSLGSQPLGADARFPIGASFTILTGSPLPTRRSERRFYCPLHGVGSIPVARHYVVMRPKLETEHLGMLQRLPADGLIYP
jgi:hypothetical protein